ncbi:hypothetical protein EW145_g2502 [Phellinidium pouzarii]|uniref:Mid2 domain-containing protein n=1 Tax=Phellinidium pouzarii TaxID=167371 RepID=A0A4S4LG23_9AGAM|nr:hypothetical protein EW145_g2502 [Phellinidium pouzarii]
MQPFGALLFSHVRFFVLLDWLAKARAFMFSYSTPTQCDNLNISWSGGRGPFSLLITPFLNVPQNISLPDSAFDESTGNGSFSMQLNLKAGLQLLLTMSDATGFATGGISEALTVGSSVSSTSCNTSVPIPGFVFTLSSELQQCSTFTFSGYDGAAQPVRILGLIPLGQAFELDPPSGPTSFNWLANVASDSSIQFIMTDSESRSGGTSDLRTVDDSGNSSCINASSPHSTLNASTALPTGIPAGSATQVVQQTVQVKAGSSTGTIVGAVAGGVALMTLVLLVTLFCLRGRRSKNVDPDMQYVQTTVLGSTGSTRIARLRGSFIPDRGCRAPPSLDLLPPSTHSLNRNFSSAQGEDPTISPFIMQSSILAKDGHSAQLPSSTYLHDAQSYYSYRQDTIDFRSLRSRSDAEGPAMTNPHSPHKGHERHTSGEVVPSTKVSLKGALRGTPRLVLHTDVNDAGAVEDEDGVIELPPQYADRRISSLKVEI